MWCLVLLVRLALLEVMTLQTPAYAVQWRMWCRWCIWRWWCMWCAHVALPFCSGAFSRVQAHSVEFRRRDSSGGRSKHRRALSTVCSMSGMTQTAPVVQSASMAQAAGAHALSQPAAHYFTLQSNSLHRFLRYCVCTLGYRSGNTANRRRVADSICFGVRQLCMTVGCTAHAPTYLAIEVR